MTENVFTCDNSVCIQSSQVCDGVDDCGDRSDEWRHDCGPCGDREFECPNGECIPFHWVCNRTEPCANSALSHCRQPNSGQSTPSSMPPSRNFLKFCKVVQVSDKTSKASNCCKFKLIIAELTKSKNLKDERHEKCEFLKMTFSKISKIWEKF